MHLKRPELEKNTVGFHAAQDPVDWIVGSEGTLGVVVEAELSLVQLPPREAAGGCIRFTSETEALRFVADARERGDLGTGPRPQCLEFFDGLALSIARTSTDNPGWMGRGAAMVISSKPQRTRQKEINCSSNGWRLRKTFDVDSGAVDFYGDAAALRAARKFRHAVPATMNERGSARRQFGGRKVSTDWAVPYRLLAQTIADARRLADENGIQQAVTYGHAGNGHPHQNFIAHDADADLKRINDVVAKTIAIVLERGGTVAAEHGLNSGATGCVRS